MNIKKIIEVNNFVDNEIQALREIIANSKFET